MEGYFIGFSFGLVFMSMLIQMFGKHTTLYKDGFKDGKKERKNDNKP